MPAAYEALRSNICGGIYYFKYQQGEDAMHPSYSVRRGRLTVLRKTKWDEMQRFWDF